MDVLHYLLITFLIVNIVITFKKMKKMDDEKQFTYADLANDEKLLLKNEDERVENVIFGDEKYDITVYRHDRSYDRKQFLKLLNSAIEKEIVKRFSNQLNIESELEVVQSSGYTLFKNSETSQYYVYLIINFTGDYHIPTQIDVYKYPQVIDGNENYFVNEEVLDELAKIVENATIEYLQNNAHLVEWKTSW